MQLLPRIPSLIACLLLAAGASAFAAPQAGALPSPVPGGAATISPADATRLAALQAERAPAAPTAEIRPQAQPASYATNLGSDVFGANLFTGNFARGGATHFNPDYRIAIGDRVQVRLWGGFAFDNVLPVDPQGNLFLPQIGPVKVAGVRNDQLQATLDAAMRRVFRANVYGYASLAEAQPVRVFVGGFVNRPGMYDGTSMDSLLQYIDQAGGIDPERGSFLDVMVKRGEQLRATVNLYEFLLEGRIPQIQLSDGDVIFVAPRHNMAAVRGLAANAKRFEFREPEISINELARLAKPQANATHVRVIRNTGTVRNVDYFALVKAGDVRIANGDEVEFTADKKPGTITVRVEGEHLSPQEYVLPYGARMGELMRNIRFSERSDADSIQLFRASVRERQKQMLRTSLKSLESSVLTARSGTSDEARLRTEEAELILRWVDRARNIEPSGQVLVAGASARDELLLENGDIIKIPSRDGLVLVSGEVLFPNAVAFENKLDVDDYIARAGGYTQNADNSRIVVAHRDGSFDDSDASIRPGDEVLVLPKVDVKSRQVFKDMTQILYQIAIAAKVAVGL